jgi:hypothetical protein
MKKLVILIVVLVLAFPFLVKLIPEPMTVERVTAAFEAAGYVVANLEELAGPQREAARHWQMTVDGYRVELFRYDNHAKLVKNLEYLKPDAGSVMVEASNLAQQLGAAPNPNLPTAVDRKGDWMLLVQGEDKTKCVEIVRVFKRS